MAKIHLSLNVSDLARSVAFYQVFLGVLPHKERPGYANFDVVEPPLKLALNEHPVTLDTGRLSHLGILMETSSLVQAAKERLQAAGLATFDETDTTCCYARQDKVWVHDPDGTAWEVYVITDDLEEDDEHDHSGNPLGSAGPLVSLAVSVPTARPEPEPLCCREGIG